MQSVCIHSTTHPLHQGAGNAGKQSQKSRLPKWSARSQVRFPKGRHLFRLQSRDNVCTTLTLLSEIVIVIVAVLRDWKLFWSFYFRNIDLVPVFKKPSYLTKSMVITIKTPISFTMNAPSLSLLRACSILSSLWSISHNLAETAEATSEALSASLASIAAAGRLCKSHQLEYTNQLGISRPPGT